MSNRCDPKHWRARAEATRAKADRFYRPEEKLRMLRVAAEYDRLAERAAELQRAEQWLDAKK
jgi:hypothetical protein